MQSAGISNIRLFQAGFLNGYREKERADARGTVRLDYMRGLERVCAENNMTASFPDVEFILRRMSVQYALFPLVVYGNQAMRSQVILRDEDNPLYDIPLNSEVSEVKLCPKCIQGQREIWIFLLSHLASDAGNKDVCQPRSSASGRHPIFQRSIFGSGQSGSSTVSCRT